MKFIFPRNYDFNKKLFGIVDYFTLTMNLIFYAFMFSICNLFFTNLNLKIFLFVSFCFPVFLLSVVGLNNENIFFVLIYILKYFKNPKLYLYH